MAHNGETQKRMISGIQILLKLGVARDSSIPGMQQVILASTKLKDFTAYQCVSIQAMQH